MRIPILGCYVSPQTPAQDFQQFLDAANELLRGNGVLLGDLNARDQSWDSTHNRRGPILRRWAGMHHFSTQRPDRPTLANASGTSRVDLCLHRHGVPPSITVYDKLPFSDHAPVRAVLASKSVSDRTRVPLALLNIKQLRDRISAEYDLSIPPIIDRLNNTGVWGDLELESRQLISKTMTPWTAFCSPNPGRFRPGWTKSLDSLAKKRTKLARSKRDSDKEEARRLDKVIKRQYRRNVKKLRWTLGDDINDGTISNQFQTVRRALSLTSDIKPMLCANVNPDSFTTFMAGLQPAPEAAPRVEVLPFTAPNGLGDAMEHFLRDETRSKQKAPGPDGVRLEILRLKPKLFADAALALWRAVGRLAFVPSLLRSGNLSPIYKNAGEPSVPSNNRPICLISAFRKMISAALLSEIDKHYSPDPRQWGHRRGSGVEAAVAYAVNTLRRDMPMAVFLDLKKAFDLVPRAQLQGMVDASLPEILSRNVRALLWPMIIRTIGQKSSDCLHTRAGVPQGDPPSPLLFGLFMDSYLRAVNLSPTRAVASLFVDDVLGLAKTFANLLRFLDNSQKWADDHTMVWNIAKSCGINLPSQPKIRGVTLPMKQSTGYLGVTMAPTGVTDARLLERLVAARGLLFKLRRTTRKWRTSVRQRRAFVKTFVLSLTDFSLFLQPLTQEVRTRAAQLDSLCTNYTLQCTVRPQQAARGRRLARLLSFQGRRKQSMVAVLWRYRSRAIENGEDERSIRLWELMSTYSTLRPMARTAGTITELPDLNTWRAEWRERIEVQDWAGSNNQKRWIPVCKNLPPALRADFHQDTERTIIHWYLNRIPGSAELSTHKNRMHELLSKNTLTTDELAEVELLSLQARHGYNTGREVRAGSA